MNSSDNSDEIMVIQSSSNSDNKDKIIKTQSNESNNNNELEQILQTKYAQGVTDRNNSENVNSNGTTSKEDIGINLIESLVDDIHKTPEEFSLNKSENMIESEQISTSKEDIGINLIESLVDDLDKTPEEFSLNKSENMIESEQISQNNILTKEMIDEESELVQKLKDEQKKEMEKLEEQRKVEEEKCFKRLTLLLSRSSIYAKFMADRLERDETKIQKQKSKSQKRTLESEPLPSKKQKICVNEVGVFKDNMNNLSFEESLKTSSNISTDKNNVAVNISHPSLFYGGVMRDYQLEGYDWLKVLYENGVNGILADEMGLGKTIQCIAMIAYLIEMGIPGPFFVCGPLSTLPNWYAEFKRFTPDIPCILYHGPKDIRVELRSKFKRKVTNNKVSCCPVIITSYSIALIDNRFLSNIKWKMLVVDEAHRIKNFECQLIRALKRYDAAHRLLLTGTPLQNNLSELWSLLNFILPEIFDDLKVFQSWFDVQKLSQSKNNDEIIAKEQEKQIVSTIHQILAPFLLRRTKSDVLMNLPPKKEVIVYSPMTRAQHSYYSSALNKSISKLLHAGDLFEIKTELGKRTKQKASYFGVAEQVDNVIVKQETKPECVDSDLYQGDGKLNLKLTNLQMLFRKIINHPYLIYRPIKPTDEDIVKLSGKMKVMDLLLAELKNRGHKVIIFSQFVSMLELLEDYCILRKYKYCRLYGSMNLEERQDEIDEFKDESVFIFLISTRAGGLGINLVSADTVIIYDSDWNPQGDLQAQDRCHRIGQTKPVIVYRLITPNSMDEKILDTSTAKRKLEKVIIQKGRFKSRKINFTQSKTLSKEELLELLNSADNDGFVEADDTDILTLEELEKLLDRSDMC